MKRMDWEEFWVSCLAAYIGMIMQFPGAPENEIYERYAAMARMQIECYEALNKVKERSS